MILTICRKYKEETCLYFLNVQFVQTEVVHLPQSTLLCQDDQVTLFVYQRHPCEFTIMLGFVMQQIF